MFKTEALAYVLCVKLLPPSFGQRCLGNKMVGASAKPILHADLALMLTGTSSCLWRVGLFCVS